MRALSTLLAGAGLALMPLVAFANDSGPSTDAVTGAGAVAQAADPARLAAAQRTVDAIFPQGTYEKLMKASLDAVLGQVVDTMGIVSPYEIATLVDMPVEEVQKIDKARIAEVQAIYDPAYRQRVEGGMRAMMDQVGALMTRVEPDVREALKRAYAGRFDATQLNELNAFFATPTGKLYAEQSMMIFLDPEIMQTMQKLMPVMMEQMPAMTEAAKSATANLPAPRRTCDLSKDELARVLKLLGKRDFPANYCDPTPVDISG